MKSPTWEIRAGDVLARLQAVPDNSVHAIVTSPPYWGLRDYKVAGQLGLERTIPEYLDAMVAVFRELRRALRPDGTLWLNLGDSFNAYNASSGAGSGFGRTSYNAKHEQRPALASGYGLRDPRLKPKDICGIPWRTAFALQDDGWWNRGEVIWHKSNTMPESVADRPTRAHEYLFLMSKSERYFYDAVAIAEPIAEATLERLDQATFANQTGGPKDAGRGGRSVRRALVNLHGRVMSPQIEDDPASFGATRNKRSVWTIPTHPYPGAHFATFPPALVEPCILAATSQSGVCCVCGAPRRRQVRATGGTIGKGSWVSHADGDDLARGRRGSWADGAPNTASAGWKDYRVETLGWEPTCECEGAESVPATVLDPFAGSGTTGMVALRHGRSFVGIELNPAYCALARQRILNDAPLLNAAADRG